MKRRRKDLKQAETEQEECQSIAQIMDAKGEKSLSPAKFPMGKCIRRAAATQPDRRRRREKGEDMSGLPQDLVMEILMRLPLKSLLRFKCVSKKWSNQISCRYFCNRLFTKVTRQQPRLYMCLVDEGGNRVLLSISSTSPDNSSFVVVDQDLSIPGMGGFFLNVVHGLMCFSVRGKPRIYNPSTKQLLTLPKIKSDIRAELGQKKKKHTRYFIGHDPVSDQYKLVCTVAISSRG